MHRSRSSSGTRSRAGARRAAGFAAAFLSIPLIAATLPREARADAFDLVFGAGRVEGTFLGEDDQTLDDLYLQIEIGGHGSRGTLRLPYVRVDPTGNVTFSPEGPVILGAGGPGRPPWQESDAGDSASGFGDALLRWEAYLMKSGGGNRPTLTFLADFKWATADEAEGLGTGEHDYGGGIDYVQPLGKVFQILGQAFYRFTGSPEDVEFNDRLLLGAGFAFHTGRAVWRLGYQTVTPILDEVPLFDANGVATGVVEVDDYEVVRGEAVFRNQAGGSMKLWVLTGLNDSSPDIGFGLAFASKPL
jgi:hypothetical protein